MSTREWPVTGMIDTGAYWSVIPPYPYWVVPYARIVDGVIDGPTVTTTNATSDTWADRIIKAKEAREAGKRMRRYKRIR